MTIINVESEPDYLNVDKNSQAKDLFQHHTDILLEVGFNLEQIKKFFNEGLIESLTPERAYQAGFGVAIDGKPVTGGLRLRFSETFAQLRLDNREIILHPNKPGKFVKYLSLAGAVDRDCAYIPAGCVAVTEGWIDAQAFSFFGEIPTGALAGLSHATKALPKGCKYTIIADHDGWANFNVTLALVKAGVHCGGKVAIVPECTIDGEIHPKAGGVEYFKSGRTAEDCRQFIDDAKLPLDLYKEWIDRQPTPESPAEAAELAVKCAKLLGEMYGYAESGTVAEIKLLLKSDKFIEWDLRLADVLRDSNNTQASLKAKREDDAEVGGGNPVQLAIELIKQRAKLFHSPPPDGTEYAEIPTKNGATIMVPIASTEFRKWVTGEYYRESGEGLTNESMNTILATIHAIAAHDSPELLISKQRIAAYDGRYYLYLADDAQTVIEYSATGWQVCENSPVKFVFDKYKAPLPIPRHSGKLDELWNIARIKDTTDRLAVTAVLVKALVPGGTDPLLVIAGYQGSGKTGTANSLRGLIDPFTKGKVLAKIPEIDHIAIHATQRRILAIDNLSHITADQSDTLCNVSTGGGFSKRTLFTDSEETILDVQNLTILTSIGNVVTKPDLLDRSIQIDMTRITERERKSESSISQGLEIHHAEILGGLLDITVAALHHRDTTEYPKYSRMVEFVHLGEGVEKYLGYESGEMKKRMAAGASIANEIAIESSPVASIIRGWIVTERDWKGTTAELLNVLKTEAKKSELAGTLPKTANSLGGELKRVESALAQSGIVIEDYRGDRTENPTQVKKKRIYIAEKDISFHPLPEKDENPSPHSPHFENNQPEALSSNIPSCGEQNENPSPHVSRTYSENNHQTPPEPLPSNNPSCGEQILSSSPQVNDTDGDGDGYKLVDSV